MVKRNMSRYSDIRQTKFGSLAEFYEGLVPDGIMTVDYNGSPLDILSIDRGSKTTIILFHAALSKSVRALPVFTGLGVTDGLDANVICISDPTLAMHEHLKLAWFGGNLIQPLQKDLPRVINKIIGAQGAEHIIFFGASGGGFASLYYSAFFRDSMAIVLNPQTIIRRFVDDAVLDYARAAFGARTLEHAHSFVDRSITGDIRHLYRGGINNNTVALVQNFMDRHHLYRHTKPLLDAIPQSDRFHILLGDWGNGHIAPPAEISRNVLQAAVLSSGNWDIALASQGFVQAPTPEYPIDVRNSAISAESGQESIS